MSERATICLRAKIDLYFIFYIYANFKENQFYIWPVIRKYILPTLVKQPASQSSFMALRKSKQIITKTGIINNGKRFFDIFMQVENESCYFVAENSEKKKTKAIKIFKVA